MKNIVQKLVGYVLAICVLLTCTVGLDSSILSAAESTTIYFLNAENWGNVYGYVWDDSGDSGQVLGNWPGRKAEKSTIGDGWYQITVPKKNNFHIIMNNGSPTDGTASQYDAEVKNGGDAVYVSTVAKDGNTIFSSKNAAEQAMGISQEYTTVYFKNSKGWSTVYGYAYQDGKDISESWPGTKAILAIDKGANWYKINVPRKASSSPFGIIFTDKVSKAEVFISDSAKVYVTPAGKVFSSSQDADEDTAGDKSENDDYEYDITLSGTGANLPYKTYEAEAADTNAEILQPAATYQAEVQTEASGRQAVKLKNTGDYVEFTLTKAANAMVLRYSMPDSSNGSGSNATLNLYVDGQKEQEVSLTSKYAWVYGEYPYTNNPSDRLPHRFFDECRMQWGKTYPAGTKIRLQKDAANKAANYIIDFIECEQVGEAIAQPKNSLSIVDYGAKPNDGRDDAEAIRNCIAAAKSQQKVVWIPKGTFTVSEKKAFYAENVTIQGAGMWHTVLEGAGASFHYQGVCKFRDFAMNGVSTVRKDAEDLAGFEGVGAAKDITIENIWMEHMKVGVWSYHTQNMIIQGCRIRNTYADGINLSSGNTNATVRNNHIRNTGDDGIAIWPNQTNCIENTIEYNTIQIPTLANGIAIYGGKENVVQYNDVADIIVNGGGICVGSMFDTSDGFAGKTTIVGNRLRRCGTWHRDYNYPLGSIWIRSANVPMTAEFEVSQNELYDSIYAGIMIDSGKKISGMTLSDNNVYGATYGIYARGTAETKVTLQNLGVAELTEEQVYNANKSCIINTTGKGIYTTTRPKDEEEACTHENTIIKEAKEATCKEEGYTGDIYCTICAKKLEEGTILAKKEEHSWDEGKITTPATATTDGVRTYTCTVCQTITTKTIPANCTHEELVNKNRKEATCKEEGYTGDWYCAICAEKLEEGTSIEKRTDHSWNEGEITKPATETQEGEITYTCIVCNETKIETIPTIAANPNKPEDTNGDEIPKLETGTDSGNCDSGNTGNGIGGEDGESGSIGMNGGNESIGDTGSHQEQSQQPAKGSVLEDTATGAKYQVLTTGDKIGTVAFMGMKKASVKTVSIPATIRLKEKNYKVTVIAKQAFQNNKKLQKVIIGKYVTKIGTKAFYGCVKLKSMTIKSKKIKAKNVGAKAFAKTNKKMIVKVPKSKAKAYKKWLLERGISKRFILKK